MQSFVFFLSMLVEWPWAANTHCCSLMGHTKNRPATLLLFLKEGTL
jgi:hypothetical protein